MSDKINAFCIAISDRFAFDTMRLTTVETGTAFSSFGENKNECGEKFNPIFNQGSLAYSLDQLIYEHNFPCPQFLKIDVDGLEGKIIDGSKKLLQDSRLKSILLELNEDLSKDQEIIQAIQNYGFIIKEKGKSAFYKKMRVNNIIFKRNNE